MVSLELLVNLSLQKYQKNPFRNLKPIKMASLKTFRGIVHMFHLALCILGGFLLFIATTTPKVDFRFIVFMVVIYIYIIIVMYATKDTPKEKENGNK
jgi:Ca2+/Na+ antiporter